MQSLPSTGLLRDTRIMGTPSALAPLGRASFTRGRGRIRPGSQSGEEAEKQTRRSHSPASRRSDVSDAASQGLCWNCGREGHGYRSCPYAWTKRFCFRYGKKRSGLHTCTHCPERISLRVGSRNPTQMFIPRVRDPRVQAAPVTEVRDREGRNPEPVRPAAPGQASQPVMIIMSGAVVHLGIPPYLPP